MTLCYSFIGGGYMATLSQKRMIGNNLKDKKIEIRVSQSDKNLIEKRALQLGFSSVSEYVRVTIIKDAMSDYVN